MLCIVGGVYKQNSTERFRVDYWTVELAGNFAGNASTNFSNFAEKKTF